MERKITENRQVTTEEIKIARKQLKDLIAQREILREQILSLERKIKLLKEEQLKNLSEPPLGFDEHD